MIEIFEQEQPLIVKLLKSKIIKEQINHAYLLVANNYSKTYELAKIFVKELISIQNISEELKENIYSKIDQEIFLDLKIVDTDGMFIKKDQLSELQEEFSLKPIENSKKFYIIKNADRLNKSSANSILKFLEEPNPNIIAILIANSENSVLDTIKSRCSIINLNGSKNVALEKENSNDFKKIAFNFIKEYESKKNDTILFTKRLWHNLLKEKEEQLQVFEYLSQIYKYLIDLKLDIEYKNDHFNDYKEELITISNNNKLEVLIKKIKIINQTKDKIYYNMNQQLLIDKMILDLGDVEK